MRTWRPVLLLGLLACVVAARQGPQPAQSHPAEVAIAPGVRYRHIQTATPEGEPWSIHVLRIQRSEKSLRIVAAAGAADNGAMARELPSKLGPRAAGSGETVLAAVNGDYDLNTPYRGIPDGLSVSSGRLWTTGKKDWPALALLDSGRPVISVPEIRIEMKAGSRRWALGALNKPLGSGHGAHPRAFTREYGAELKSSRAFRAVVIEQLSPPLPLRVNSTVRGVLADVVEDLHSLRIPPNAMVVADYMPATQLAHSGASFPDLARGAKVELRFGMRMAGHKQVQEAIGGFPILVRGGRRSIVGTPSAYLSQRHPRTAACYNDREIIFAVVDGRQPALSVGMTLEELADLMVSLGCKVALNTDGGGSSVMAVALPSSAPNFTSSTGTPAQGSAQGSPSTSRLAPRTSHLAPHTSHLTIVNSPSDGAERGRGNAWVILKKEVRR